MSSSATRSTSASSSRGGSARTTCSSCCARLDRQRGCRRSPISSRCAARCGSSRAYTRRSATRSAPWPSHLDQTASQAPQPPRSNGRVLAGGSALRLQFAPRSARRGRVLSLQASPRGAPQSEWHQRLATIVRRLDDNSCDRDLETRRLEPPPSADTTAEKRSQRARRRLHRLGQDSPPVVDKELSAPSPCHAGPRRHEAGRDHDGSDRALSGRTA